LKQIQALGLTTKEVDVSRSELLGRVRPGEIDPKEFLDAVNGPSSRVGGLTASK
jgi:hypothetical protein